MKSLVLVGFYTVIQVSYSTIKMPLNAHMNMFSYKKCNQTTYWQDCPFSIEVSPRHFLWNCGYYQTVGGVFDCRLQHVTDTLVQFMFVHSSSHWPEAKKACAAFRDNEVPWSSSPCNNKEKVYTNTALVKQKCLKGWRLGSSANHSHNSPCILRELPVDMLIHVVAVPW